MAPVHELTKSSPNVAWFFWGKSNSEFLEQQFLMVLLRNLTQSRGCALVSERVSNEKVSLINHRFSQRMVTIRNGAATLITLTNSSSIYHVYMLSNPPRYKNYLYSNGQLSHPSSPGPADCWHSTCPRKGVISSHDWWCTGKLLIFAFKSSQNGCFCRLPTLSYICSLVI